MDFIFSFFTNFTTTTYVVLVLVLLCFLFAGNLKTDRGNSPVFPLIISNGVFWYYLSTIQHDFGFYFKCIIFSSVFCICWFLVIKEEENEENKKRGGVRDGKDLLNTGYGKGKDAVKSGVSSALGGGVLGEITSTLIDLGTESLDGRVSGLIDSLGNSREYFHPSRGMINTLRNLLILSILMSIFYLRKN